MNGGQLWLSILPDLGWLMARCCFPTGPSWLQGHQWTCRNSWASCKNTHTHTYQDTQTVKIFIENTYTLANLNVFLFCRVRRDLRDPLESQETRETKWVNIVKAVKSKKRWNTQQNLNGGSDPDVQCKHTEYDLVIFCRAALVSRAHRVQLAKKERMWVDTLLFVCFTVAEVLRVHAKLSPPIHLFAFSGSAGYWWKRWHTWHSWNQGECVCQPW